MDGFATVDVDLAADDGGVLSVRRIFVEIRTAGGHLAGVALGVDVNVESVDGVALGLFIGEGEVGVHALGEGGVAPFVKAAGLLLDSVVNIVEFEFESEGRVAQGVGVASVFAVGVETIGVGRSLSNDGVEIVQFGKFPFV